MKFRPAQLRSVESAFTMVEIAICLAIIGIALVAIIGILPYGLNTQKATREETIINQDAATLLPIITQGARGADDLTNYIYAITNYCTLYNADGTIDGKGKINSYTLTNSSSIGLPFSSGMLTNGVNIVGLLSTPEFIANHPPNYPAFPGVVNDNGYQVYSNYIVAYVRSLSGLAAEKPPQSNPLVVDGSFGYRLLVVNAPVALDTNSFNTPYNRQLWQNQREFRMTFQWPLLPNGNIGNEKPLTYRATVAGQLAPAKVNGQTLYFYQPQSFGVNTNLP